MFFPGGSGKKGAVTIFILTIIVTTLLLVISLLPELNPELHNRLHRFEKNRAAKMVQDGRSLHRRPLLNAPLNTTWKPAQDEASLSGE